jgi:hypothetical protein
MNFKRVVALLVVVAMLLIQLPMMAFATVLHQAEAEALHDLGLFEGITQGTFTPALENPLNRQEGITILLRLLGKTAEADAITPEEIETALAKYTDKNEVADWALKNVAYVVKNGIVIGTSATTLEPLSPLAGNAYATMILKNLGYDVNYPLACVDLEAKGAIGVASFIINKNLIRDDAVVMSLGALLAKYSVGEKTVCEVLIEKGLFTAETAREVLARFGMVISALEPTSSPTPTATPSPTPEFVSTIVADKPELPADTSAQTLVKFELRDSVGNLINADSTVKFESSLGNFDSDTVTLVGGVATAMLTAEYLEASQDAIITATIKTGPEKYLNHHSTFSLRFVANVMPAGGAAMVWAKSLGADRVIMHFDRPVDLANYVNPDTKLLDETKCIIQVRKASTSATTGENCVVKGFLPVAKDPMTLIALLDIETSQLNALQDNAQVWVSFNDKTKDTPVVREKSFNFMEVTRPSIVSVEATSYYTLKVIFSEPVYYDTLEYLQFKQHEEVCSLVQYSAKNPINYAIDGIPLNDDRWGDDTTIKVGTFDPLKGTDNRRVVTIVLGKVNHKRVSLPVGNHSLKCINVGDWAEPNDVSNNDVDPQQDIDFVVGNTNVAPIASLEVLSPEEYVLTFSKDVAQGAHKIAENIELQRYSAITRVWSKVASAYTNSNPSSQDNGKQKLLVTRGRDIEGKLLVADEANKSIDQLGHVYIIECDDDWSRDLNGSDEKFYYSSDYRLVLNGDTVLSAESGEGNVAANLPLTGPMTVYDTTSPTVLSIAKSVGREEGMSYDVTMSEPCKFDTNLNEEGTTISLDQQAGVGVPVPKVRFISKDNPSIVITGCIERVDTSDTVFTVTMLNGVKLDPGVWTMELSQCSDDVGNTLNSAPKEITVKDVNGFRVLWFFADVDDGKLVENTDPEDNDSSFDYVFVKFSNPISVAGSYTEAFKNSNYQINGRPLPSGTTIENSIAGFDEGRLDRNVNTICDSVTIKLPDGYLASLRGPTSTGGVNNVSITVKSTIKNALGVSLRNETDIPHQAPYYDDSVSGNDVMKPYFGHLGYLKGGKDSPSQKATGDFTLFTIPKDGSILTIGNQRVGFNSTGNPIDGCDLIINTLGASTTGICNAIESNLPIGNVTCIPSDNNILNLESSNAGYFGNNILVSLN